MLKLLWLIPALPLAGFLVLALCGGRLFRWQVAWVGCGSVGMAAVTTALVGVDFFRAFPDRASYRQTLWNWIDTSGMTVGVTWYLDALSFLMVAVITGIGFLIHLYSVEYMSGTGEADGSAPAGEAATKPSTSAASAVDAVAVAIARSRREPSARRITSARSRVDRDCGQAQPALRQYP